MKKNKIVLIILIVIVTGVIVTFRTSNSQSQTVRLQQKNEEEIPVVDLYSSKENELKYDEIRKERGQKYNKGNSLEEVESSISELLELPLSHAPSKPALPVIQSDAIVIGTINNTQAFLSSDKSYVYSEFTVQIEKTLKNKSSIELNPDNIITAERSGGIVRFSSDRTLRLGVSGQGFPTKNNRYLLFLKWSESGKDFLILTGYKLQNGKVTPLDGDIKNNEFSIYKNYKLYKNKDESSFIQAVRNAIENPLQEGNINEQ